MAVYEHGSSKTHIQITSSSPLPPSVAPCETTMGTMMAGMGGAGGSGSRGLDGGRPGCSSLSGFM